MTFFSLIIILKYNPNANMYKISLILKFFLIELKALKKNFFDIFNLIKTVSLIKFLIYMIDKNQIEIFRDNYLNQYLRKNYSFWKLNKIDEEKFILVDLTLSTHPMHAIVQCILVNIFLEK